MAKYALVKTGIKIAVVLAKGDDIETLVEKGKDYRKKHPKTRLVIARIPIINVVKRYPKKK